MESQKNSTPIRPKRFGRESLAFIRPNTVTHLVEAFSKNTLSIPAENYLPVDVNPIVGQTKFFDELSSIHESPERTGDDSGFESMASRGRSNTIGMGTTNEPRNILKKYAQFPNFKWSQLKYFGISHPKEYMMSNFNIDELPSYAMTINLNNVADVRKGKFINMRKRSQSFAADKGSQSIEKKRKVEIGDLYGTADATKIQPEELSGRKDAVKRIEKQLHVCADSQFNSVDSNDSGSSTIPNNQRQTVEDPEDLKIRIQKSIESFDKYREIRKPSS